MTKEEYEQCKIDQLTVELAAKESDARIKLTLLSKYRDGGYN